MEFKEVINRRYSCRRYSDRQVEPEKLKAILNAGRLAPTAKNLQELAPGAKVVDGKKFSPRVSEKELKEWADQVL